jgi:hypothetical protein
MQCRRRTGSFSSFYSALQALVCAAGLSWFPHRTTIGPVATEMVFAAGCLHR